MYRIEKEYEYEGGPTKYLKKRRLKTIHRIRVADKHKSTEFQWYRDFTKECRHIRLALNLSQYELGHQIGSTQAGISRFEAGKVAPTVEFLDRLVVALGKTIKIELS